jgi:hypothetical protein
MHFDIVVLSSGPAHLLGRIIIAFYSYLVSFRFTIRGTNDGCAMVRGEMSDL